MKAKNPTGRLDVLAARLIERVVEHKAHPVLSALYAEVKSPLETVLRKKLGPRNKSFRNLPKYIAQGQKMLAERQAGL